MSEMGAPTAGDPAAEECLTAAWASMYNEPARCTALAREAAARAEAVGDIESWGMGMFLACFDTARTADEATALQAIDTVLERCSQVGAHRGAWSCQDAYAMVDYRFGRASQALRRLRSNDELAPGLRSLPECCLTLKQLDAISSSEGQFELALRYGYRHLALAHASGLPVLRAIALVGLAATHIVAMNYDEGLPLHEQASELLLVAGGRAMLPRLYANTIYIHVARGRPEAAVATLQAWERECGAPSPLQLQMFNVPIGLAHLAAGDLQRAEAVLSLGPPTVATEVHQAAAWHWASAQLLCAQGRPAEALQRCRDHLTRPERHPPDTAFNRVQLHETERRACEALGDYRAALEAAKAAHAAARPLVASSVRVRYLSLQIQLEQGGRQGGGPQHQRRMRALERGLAQYDRHSADHLAHLDTPPSAEGSASRKAKRFVAHVSHEMRSPLSGVLGLTSLLMLSNLDERQRKLVSLAQRSAESLLRLVNDLLDITKLEAGRFELCPAPFSLPELAREVVDLFEPLAQEKGLALSLELDPALPDRLQGDALRLNQVLSNLVFNAVKFTRRGQVCLRVRCGEPSRTAALRIEVADTGPGLPAEALPRLFMEFEQAGAPSAGMPRGSGLGLALCRQLIERMGGRIGVDSQYGTGSTFWVELALPVATQDPAIAPA